MNYRLVGLLLALLPGLAACTPSSPDDAVSLDSVTPKAMKTEQYSLDEAAFRQHVAMLASDEFEGRSPSSPGEQKTNRTA